MDINGPVSDLLRSDRITSTRTRPGTLLLNVRPQGKWRRQGLTELTFESAEPPFDELTPAVFFDRFPEGTYQISGRATSGTLPQNLTNLTHVMPAPPDNLRVNGVPLPKDCEDGPVLTVSGAANILIEWDPSGLRKYLEKQVHRRSCGVRSLCPDVLVHVEEVVGVVLFLDASQARVVVAVGRLHSLLPFLHHEVDVSSARRIGMHCVEIVLSPHYS